MSGDATISSAGVLALANSGAAQLGLNSGGVVRRGKSIKAGEGTRTSPAYGSLGSGAEPGPDQVSNVVLPTDGLIVMAFQALVKSSVAGAGSAAIFIGANQLKRAGPASPAVQETSTNSSAADNYDAVSSYGGGLIGSDSSVAETGLVVTGQLVGVGGSGGVCYIFAAAGTYDIGVQFKATSGSVTAKERKLWVWSMGF